MRLEGSPQPMFAYDQGSGQEKRLETGKKVFEFLNRTKFLEFRKADERFEAWLQGLTYEDFKDYATRLNGILRDTPIKNRSIDGRNTEVSASMGFLSLTAYLPPAPEQKDLLMRESFEGVKKLSSNQDRASLLYYVIQAIHPYSDANGRTGRLLHDLISENGKELNSEKLSTLLDHDRAGHAGMGKGRDVFAERLLEPKLAYAYVNREVTKELLGEDFVNEYGIIFVAANDGEGMLPEDIQAQLSPEETRLARKILGESDVYAWSFRGIVLAKLIREKTELQKYLHGLNKRIDANRTDVPEDVGKKFYCIVGDELMQHLSADEVKRLIEIHREVKEKFIKCMIDIFVHPEDHQLKTKAGENFAIKDVLQKK